MIQTDKAVVNYIDKFVSKHDWILKTTHEHTLSSKAILQTSSYPSIKFLDNIL